jgi:uncharacterized protein DUF3892
MAKWADWLILRVRYNAAHTHIDSVEITEDLGDTYGQKQFWTRSKVIQTIQVDKKIVFTAPPDPKDPAKVVKGAKVEVVPIGNDLFIKTVPDSTKRDNLGSLPEF